MLPIAYYLLKVIICSGILYGYYWLALRNKVFHRYNRFYLMASVVLSMLLPLMKIGFWQQQEQQQSSVIRVLQAVSNSDEYMDNVVISSDSNNFHIEQLYPFAYILISLILLVTLFHTLFVIARLLRKFPKQTIDKISFINTDAKSTPFSFLNYIFWNYHIDLETTTGNQIFKHELAHVQEGHTYDKLFINLVLVVFWCNPFYWLYRKELNMIHEFIADKKAVEDNDTEAFAAMILQATYPQHRFQLTNNFFYSPIKRRLLMLTKNKNAKVNYIGRIMVLPLLVLVFAAFTFKTKTTHQDREKIAVTSQQQPVAISDIFNFEPPKHTMFINTKYADTSYFKTAAYKTKALVIVDSKEIGNLGMDYVEKSKVEYSSLVTYNPVEGLRRFGQKGKYGVIKLTVKEVLCITADSIHIDEKNNSVKLSGKTTIKSDLDDAVIYVEGKKITATELNAIAPSKISSVNILKGEKLDEIVEDANGKKAIINISLKPDDLKEVIVTGKKAEPIYVVDNKIQSSSSGLNAISPDNISRIDVLKDNSAIAKYGEQGKNGVVEITTKYDAVIVEGKPATIAGDLAFTTKDTVRLLYIGIENKVSLPDGIDPDDVMTNITNGSIRSGKAAGSYIVTVSPHGSLTISVYNKERSRIIRTIRYEVAMLPDPKNDLKEVTVTGYPNYPTTEDKVFTRVEIEPAYPGGGEAWKNYLRKNLDASMPINEGWKAGTYTVILQFIVHSDGTVSDVSTINFKGTKTAQHCIDLIKKTANWSPALQNGKPVNAWRRQPITFLIQPDDVKKDITGVYSIPVKAHLLNDGKINTYHLLGNGQFTVNVKALYYLNGKITSEPSAIKKEKVTSIETYDEKAGQVGFGEKGRYGVTMINTKS